MAIDRGLATATCSRWSQARRTLFGHAGADRVWPAEELRSIPKAVFRGSHRDIWDRPRYPCTRSLIAAVPGAEQRKAA